MFISISTALPLETATAAPVMTGAYVAQSLAYPACRGDCGADAAGASDRTYTIQTTAEGNTVVTLDSATPTAFDLAVGTSSPGAPATTVFIQALPFSHHGIVAIVVMFFLGLYLNSCTNFWYGRSTIKMTWWSTASK
ncbi:hypothetical protein B0H11DRAFT_2037386 [Mycena galericulata]|nr:hypothetical protein B0H11DRAFT_2037386 [Mycena galericulata]